MKPKPELREDLKPLKAIVERNREERERTEKFKKALYERRDEIRNAPAVMPVMAFWCDTCKRDTTGPGFKEIRWPKNGIWFAFYRGFCLKGHALVRRITDKLGDPYFYKSKLVRVQQSKHADDFLTPDDPRFKDVYPTQWADYQARARWEGEQMKVKPGGP